MLMSLALQINRDDTRAIYLQIASQIRNQISVGRLPPGTRLPSVRNVAKQLHINRLTVHNAYSELQADGWVESTVGRGTYVLEHAQPLHLLSSLNSDGMPDSVLADFQPIKQIPTLRSLASTEPDPALAPIDEFWGSLMALRREANPLLSYEVSQGDPSLRVELTKLLMERGVQAMPDEIMVTAGAMQGLSLTARALLNEGDVVLVEEPTYLGIIHLLRTLKAQIVTVPMLTDGPDMEVMEAVLKKNNVRFFYTVSSFQNPTGYSMSVEKRRALIRMARRYDFHIVEDDNMGALAYDAPAPLALKSFDVDDRVIYVSSISKSLMPGLRVGWVVAPKEIHRLLIQQRLADDLYGPPFVQKALANFLQTGRLKVHLRRVMPIYKTRRDAMIRALAHHMPEGVTWTYPEGGFCNWLTLPNDNMMTIYRLALHRGIAFTPGSAFVASHINNRHLRLCFSTQPAEELEPIISLLAGIIREHMDAECVGHCDENPVWTPIT